MCLLGGGLLLDWLRLSRDLGFFSRGSFSWSVELVNPACLDFELLVDTSAGDSGVGDFSLTLESCDVVWCDEETGAVLREERVGLGGSGDRAMSSNIPGSTYKHKK